MVARSFYRLYNRPGPLDSTCHRNHLPDYLVGTANENQVEEGVVQSSEELDEKGLVFILRFIMKMPIKSPPRFQGGLDFQIKVRNSPRISSITSKPQFLAASRNLGGRILDAGRRALS